MKSNKIILNITKNQKKKKHASRPLAHHTFLTSTSSASLKLSSHFISVPVASLLPCAPTHIPKPITVILLSYHVQAIAVGLVYSNQSYQQSYMNSSLFLNHRHTNGQLLNITSSSSIAITLIETLIGLAPTPNSTLTDSLFLTLDRMQITNLLSQERPTTTSSLINKSNKQFHITYNRTSFTAQVDHLHPTYSRLFN